MRRLLLIFATIILAHSLSAQEIESVRKKPDYWGETKIVVSERYNGELYTATIRKPDYWGEVRIDD